MTTPSAPPTPPSLAALGAEAFVALSTYRRSGVAVSTPVWVAPSGDGLVVTTPAASGKVKRLGNDQRVQLVACSRSGKVEPGAVPLEAVAEVLGPNDEHPEAVAALRSKYGVQYRVITAVEAVSRRVRRQRSDRVMLRISEAPAQ